MATKTSNSRPLHVFKRNSVALLFLYYKYIPSTEKKKFFFASASAAVLSSCFILSNQSHPMAA